MKINEIEISKLKEVKEKSKMKDKKEKWYIKSGILLWL